MSTNEVEDAVRFSRDKPKGLLSLFLSLPDSWKYSVGGLAKICILFMNRRRMAPTHLSPKIQRWIILHWKSLYRKNLRWIILCWENLCRKTAHN